MNLVLSGAFVPSSGNVFTIVSATSVSGKFKGLANNATLVFNGRTLRVNYAATAVTLTDITSGGSSTSSQSATFPATVTAGVTPASTCSVTSHEGVNPLAGWLSLDGNGRANSMISTPNSDITAFSTATLAVAEPLAMLSSASPTVSRSDIASARVVRVTGSPEGPAGVTLTRPRGVMSGFRFSRLSRKAFTPYECDTRRRKGGPTGNTNLDL